ncbi:MAG: hypothetical protein K7J47_09250 [Acidobacteria bacterium]|nr:hypothetical protein [Bryobacteraceae bacterium CoA2 C42]
MEAGWGDVPGLVRGGVFVFVDAGREVCWPGEGERPVWKRDGGDVPVWCGGVFVVADAGRATMVRIERKI